MRDAVIARLSQMAADDARLMLITGDLGFGVLTDFAKTYPNQFINAGVAEQNMTAVACGMAMDDRRVFTYSIGNFPTMRCLEQIRNDICYHDASVTILAVGGGFSYGQLGMSHHATEDIAIMRALPNMTVVVPADEWEAAEAVAALALRPGPSYLRIDKSKAHIVRRDDEAFVLGRANVLRQGHDLTLIGTGGILGEVLAAADTLDAAGIRCRVLNMHTIKPIDVDAIAAAAGETGGILTVEEHSVIGGLGGAVAETLAELGIATPFRRLGLADTYSSVVGDQAYLRRIYGLDRAAIAAAAEILVAGCQILLPS